MFAKRFIFCLLLFVCDYSLASTNNHPINIVRDFMECSRQMMRGRPAIEPSLSSLISAVTADRWCREEGSTCRLDYECCGFSCFEGYCVPEPDYDEVRKRYIGEFSLSSKDCESGLMNSIGICIGSYSYLAQISQYCESHFQCTSGICDGEANVCLGSRLNGKRKASYGQYCTDNRECLSHRCSEENSTCLGGFHDPAFAGEYCYSELPAVANKQCRSRRCNLENRKCLAVGESLL